MGICQEPEDAGGRESTRWRLSRHPRACGCRTHPRSLKGVLEVAEDTWLLSGRRLREAGVVHAADESLEPGRVPAEGSGLLGKWPVGTLGVGSFACTPIVSAPSRTECSLRLALSDAHGTLWIG